MVGHGASSAGSYLADPTSPIPSHCASTVVTSTLTDKTQVDHLCFDHYILNSASDQPRSLPALFVWMTFKLWYEQANFLYIISSFELFTLICTRVINRPLCNYALNLCLQ